ncbi:S1 RNA-binding domain-containing protein 1 isoform X3 [Bicyclus anynana]|nr:S1 RNA-binding domain-containing protein 1 isoform X3 [Bicyclus anynana]XP_052737578.1 S1 RNA-binding domain-containing protein 1 isoform X3 [Bicyclus anynana]
MNMEKKVEKITKKRKLEEPGDIDKPVPKKRLTTKKKDTGETSATLPKPKRNIVKKSEPKSRSAKKEKETFNENDFENQNKENKESDEYNNYLNEVDMLSYFEKIPPLLAQKFISLLSDGCTLPFIARYRKEAVNHLMPDRLQELYDSYQNVIQLKKKVKSVLETLKKSNKLTPEIEQSILNAKNLSEVDLVYSPLKSHSLSLAERARNLGLESHAVNALNGGFVDVKKLCDSSVEELASFDKVEAHLTHLIADIIYKDTRVLQQMRTLKEETRFILQSSRTKSSTKEKPQNDNKKPDTKTDPETYKLYFEWKCPVNFVKCYQTLAVNRGEDEKILSVKVVVPDWFYNKLERYCLTLWKSKHWVCKGLGDAYNRLIKPWLSRKVRADLTNAAQKEAVKTFTTNLEKYLLTEPVKNRPIAGLDPGFKAGCKVGVIDATGAKLEACNIYPHFHSDNDPAASQLTNLLSKHRVELIGLGNGTACRQTESWLKKHHISDKIPVIIVPEQGASIYSISKEAQKEHPNMDPNLISALSIARRVLDPLGELIKVEPKNLGVGLYQHDIPPKMLETALDGTVEKVVSLVGVDLNTASQAMLRRISGLNEGRAKKIMAYRQENGGFKSRAEIMKVAGIGKITYQQCAGFLKVLGGPEPLDTTIIHPESYTVAKSFAKKIGVNIKELNQPQFPRQVEMKTYNIDLSTMSKDLDVDVSTLELIVNAFKQKAYEDNMITFCRPVYSMTVQNSEQLEKGMSLTGVVRNVVPFGCFVDCGVGDNGLIHTKNLGNANLKLGDRVAVTVISTPRPKKLQLKLDKILD